MKILALILFIAVITSCASMHSDDPNSLFFDIPKGSTLALNEKITIPHNETHSTFQFGKVIVDKDKKDYDINCRLDFKKFGPRTIEPENFTVSRTEDGTNWISYSAILRFYTEIYLSSDKDTDVIKMVCQQYGDANDRNFTVAEMQEALGDIVTFNYSHQ